MVNRVQSLRSSVAGARPANGTRSVGEIYTNFPDLQLGVIDTGQVARDLLPIRYFSTLASYAIGDHVIQAGVLYRAIAASPPGAFVPANWTANVNAADLAAYAQLSGAAFTGPITGTSATFNDTVTITDGQWLALDGPPGTERSILGLTNGTVRWIIEMGSNDPETGANAGSSFVLHPYTDAGVPFPSATLVIQRANNACTFGGTISAPGYASRSGLAGAYTGNFFNLCWVNPMQLWVDGTNLGNIQVVSDYRAKENIAPLPSTWSQVKALKPISFTFKDFTPPGRTEKLITKNAASEWGFIAHELQQTLLPSAATGVKDQADCIQSPNWPPIVAALTKALQEAMERIEELTERVTTLEAAR